MHHANNTEIVDDPLAALHPVTPAMPAAPQVFRLLKEAILTMSVAPGQPLSEPDIGARLGVSRTPVREAFAQLRAIDLVATLPSRGSYVTKLNAHKIREAQYLREALEIATVQRLVTNGIGAAQHTALEGNLVAQQRAVVDTERTTFHRLDDEFHFLLAKATGFPRAAVVLGQEKAQLDRLRVLSLRDEGHFAALYEDHRQVFAAICNGDLARAMAVTVPHLRSVLTVLEGVATDHTEYFDTTVLS